MQQAPPLRARSVGCAETPPVVGSSGRPAREASWGEVRLLEFRGGPMQFRPRRHLVGLNLGPRCRLEVHRPGRTWTSVPLAHLGTTLLPVGAATGLRLGRPDPYVVVEFTPAFAARVLRTASPGVLRPTLAGEDGFVAQLVQALAALLPFPAADAAFRAGRVAAALVLHLARPATPPARQATAGATWLAQVIAYIHDHVQHAPTVEQLAGMAGMDCARFSRAFKRATGAAPHAYVLAVRITRARQLLREAELPVREVALQTGFLTLSHFDVVFHRLVGLTPSRFRDLSEPPSRRTEGPDRRN